MIHGGNVWQGDDPGKWLDYSANLRPGGAPEWVRRAVLSGMENMVYYPQLSMERARKAMGAYLDLDAQLVLPTAGGISAIAMAAQLEAAYTLVLTPSFAEYVVQAANHGQPVETLSLLGADHRITSPADCVRGKLREGVCLWLCNPLNPVGTAFPREEIARLLRIVEEKNGWLVVDEAFIDYCPEHSVRSWIPGHDRLLVTGSLTKILSVPGVRLGYLCAGPALQKLALRQTAWELNSFAEAVTLVLPEHKADIAADGQKNRRRREIFHRQLEALGVYVYPSQASFLLADFGRAVRPLEEHLYRQNILVRSCMSFPGLNDGCHLRLAVKDEASNDHFICVLQEAME